MSKVVDHEEQQPEEEGGIVTTVRTAESSDLDLQATLKETETADEEKPDKEPEKPKAKADDIDLKALSPEVQAYIGRLNKERRINDRKLRQELDRLERSVETLKTQRPTMQAQQPQAPVRPTRPDPTKFASDTEYNKAQEKYEDELADYKYSVKREQEKKEDLEKQQKAEDEKTVAKFNKDAAAFADEHPDYEEVMDSDLELSAVMFGYIMETGPWLGYHLATHPDEATEIFKLSDNQQIKRLERMIAKHELEAEPKATARETKEKPKPVSPVASRTAAAKDRSTMSFKEREAEWNRLHPGELNYMS